MKYSNELHFWFENALIWSHHQQANKLLKLCLSVTRILWCPRRVIIIYFWVLVSGIIIQSIPSRSDQNTKDDIRIQNFQTNRAFVGCSLVQQGYQKEFTHNHVIEYGIELQLWSDNFPSFDHFQHIVLWNGILLTRFLLWAGHFIIIYLGACWWDYQKNEY